VTALSQAVAVSRQTLYTWRERGRMALEQAFAPPRAADPPPTKARRARNQKVRKLTRTDLIVVSVMVAVPTLLVLVLVWFPAVATVVLSFTRPLPYLPLMIPRNASQSSTARKQLTIAE